MKWIAGLALLSAMPAHAQSPELQATCTDVAKNFFMTETLNVGVIQSFPELKPPGVRFTYSQRADAKKTDMSDAFECEFDQPQPPYALLRFCVSRTCYSLNEDDADRKRRFEEMRVLLKRTNDAR
ncbi:hypothetical protein JQ506_10595 [Shinella sp. PSBB067]|uniref:hypothetical protein n=1 Tax=Shinella sp. PSBB067 TaxID=2715959 RepID=UPI0009282DB3|nr:hypothetical protein [Shinella sp. PSBB067]OJV02699.1 MAG: hypothetical protein BGO06_19380 [Shinella sp. 65-6]QRI65384.1 hypothetical protein JQ506_10595 [Shinella sp. PSBB067]